MATLLEQFDAAIETVTLHDGPCPGGKSVDWLKGQDAGILHGIKIARSILREILTASNDNITQRIKDALIADMATCAADYSEAEEYAEKIIRQATAQDGGRDT